LVFELEPMYATSDGQMDRRTDGRRAPITALCPLGGGIIKCRQCIAIHSVFSALLLALFSQRWDKFVNFPIN